MAATESLKAMVWRRFKKHRLAFWSLGGLGFLLLLCYGIPLIAPLMGWDPDFIDLYARYEGMSLKHPFGTDELGRDVFLRLMYGGRISLTVGLISALTAALIGTTIGVIAGYFGGWIDSILMRFTDAMLSVPVLPLMIVFAALDLRKISQAEGTWNVLGIIAALIFVMVCLGQFISNKRAQILPTLLTALLSALACALPLAGLIKLLGSEQLASGTMASVVQLIIIVVFFSWMTVARLVRASALQIREMEYIDAARMLGAPSKHIITTHIIPNAMAPIIVAATLEVGGVVLYESVLSFLGLGVKPPTASWGNMLRNALDYLQDSPLLAFWPGVFILVAVVCVNFFGDGLRDALDPHEVHGSQK
ncbi:MAG: ABC transporter permease [Myxococcota bacterium]|jgi:peptide/nickel transport system permease protein|nr:ABC transporter permease [Myxococcota bacterium]